MNEAAAFNVGPENCPVNQEGFKMVTELLLTIR